VCAAEADKWMHNHPVLAISQSDICLIFRNAYERVANMEKAKHAFQATGIHPFIPDVFSDADFLSSEVTNWPQGSLNEDPTGETNKELQVPMFTEKIAAENNTCANWLLKKYLSDGDEEESERARISPSNIFPIPKAKITVKIKRIARRSEIMTCSPFKNSLLDVYKKKRAQIQLGQKRNSLTGILLESHPIQEKRRWLR
jgi:hypothetical protein